MDFYRSHVLVCHGTGCTSSDSPGIKKQFEEAIAAKGLDKEVQVVMTGCFGLCALGPVVIIYPEGSFYSRVTVDDVDEIVEEHLVKGRIVSRLLYQESIAPDASIRSLEEVDFYKKQKRVALRNCGVINPEKIEEYIAMDGYKALGKVLTEMKPQEVIDIIKASGLRGRGGGGSPPASSGVLRATAPARNTSSATRTRATPARSWTGPCWRATPTSCWRPWPSRAMPSARPRGTSMCAPSTPSRSNAWRSLSVRRARWAFGQGYLRHRL